MSVEKYRQVCNWAFCLIDEACLKDLEKPLALIEGGDDAGALVPSCVEKVRAMIVAELDAAFDKAFAEAHRLGYGPQALPTLKRARVALNRFIEAGIAVNDGDPMDCFGAARKKTLQALHQVGRWAERFQWLTSAEDPPATQSLTAKQQSPPDAEKKTLPLARKQQLEDAAIAHLVGSGGTMAVTRIAELIGVPPSTLRSWSRFNKVLDEYQRIGARNRQARRGRRAGNGDYAKEND